MALTVHYLWWPTSKRPAILCGEDCSYVSFSSVAYKPVFPQSDTLAGIGSETAVGVCGFLCAEGAGVEPAKPWSGVRDLKDRWAYRCPTPPSDLKGV